MHIIRSDLYKYSVPKGFTRPCKGLRKPRFRFMFFLRIIHCIKKPSQTDFKCFPFKRHYSYKYGFRIPRQSNVDAGLFIGYIGNIALQSNTSIEINCDITQGVIIGKANVGIEQGYFAIGINFWIGANSVIVGRIIIGANVLITSLSYVNIDIRDNSLVMGSPTRINLRGDTTCGYTNYTTN